MFFNKCSRCFWQQSTFLQDLRSEARNRYSKGGHDYLLANLKDYTHKMASTTFGEQLQEEEQMRGIEVSEA